MTYLPGAVPKFVSFPSGRNSDAQTYDRLHRQKHQDIENEFLALVNMLGVGSGGLLRSGRSANAPLSTASAVLVDSGLSFTLTTIAGEPVFIGFDGVFVDTAAFAVCFFVYVVNGVQVWNSGLYSDGTVGVTRFVSHTDIITAPGTGTFTYKLQFSTSAGTLTLYSSMWAAALKRIV